MLFAIKKQTFEEAKDVTERLGNIGVIDIPVYYAKSKSQLKRRIIQANLKTDEFVIVSVKQVK